jgi:hypothetical protein
MSAGRPHEADGNVDPRWMAVSPAAARRPGDRTRRTARLVCHLGSGLAFSPVGALSRARRSWGGGPGGPCVLSDVDAWSWRTGGLLLLATVGALKSSRWSGRYALNVMWLVFLPSVNSIAVRHLVAGEVGLAQPAVTSASAGRSASSARSRPLPSTQYLVPKACSGRFPVSSSTIFLTSDVGA